MWYGGTCIGCGSSESTARDKSGDESEIIFDRDHGGDAGVGWTHLSDTNVRAVFIRASESLEFVQQTVRVPIWPRKSPGIK